MVEFRIGFAVRFEKKKKPFLNGALYANENGDMMIELHDPKYASEFIAGLIPPTKHTTKAEGSPMNNNERQRQSYHG